MPSTGESIRIKVRAVARFTPGSRLQKAVNWSGRRSSILQGNRQGAPDQTGAPCLFLGRLIRRKCAREWHPFPNYYSGHRLNRHIRKEGHTRTACTYMIRPMIKLFTRSDTIKHNHLLSICIFWNGFFLLLELNGIRIAKNRNKHICPWRNHRRQRHYLVRSRGTIVCKLFKPLEDKHENQNRYSGILSPSFPGYVPVQKVLLQKK